MQSNTHARTHSQFFVARFCMHAHTHTPSLSSECIWLHMHITFHRHSCHLNTSWIGGTVSMASRCLIRQILQPGHVLKQQVFLWNGTVWKLTGQPSSWQVKQLTMNRYDVDMLDVNKSEMSEINETRKPDRICLTDCKVSFVICYPSCRSGANEVPLKHPILQTRWQTTILPVNPPATSILTSPSQATTHVPHRKGEGGPTRTG